MADVRDILELESNPTPEITKETFIKPKNRTFEINKIKTTKRPEGMAREVYALLYNDSKDAPPILPTDTALGIGAGYKQKAKLGMKKVRKWEWAGFINPARTDQAIFHHWRRAGETVEYPFAQFNKKLDIPTYTLSEYNAHLRTNQTKWSKNETDHLFDLAQRFDLRFVVMADRWDRASFGVKTVEDLKERYYEVIGILQKLRGEPEKKIYTYDADHERKRKEQLVKIFDRTQSQVAEEMALMSELKRIEARKKEREKKTQDLQKLISQADKQGEQTQSLGSPATTSRKYEKKLYKKKNVQNLPKPSKVDNVVNNLEVTTTGIKFPELRASGVSCRSQKMKLPANIGQKKAKSLEAALIEFKLDPAPPPTEEICNAFNELRSDIVLLCELRSAFKACKFELESLKHQYEAECPGKTLKIPNAITDLSEEIDPLDGEIVTDIEVPPVPIDSIIN